ncbi:Ribulose bisphosphate carboxylase small chain 3A [Corchorus olitorius]|uniref:Ribulose bisphosphate carboxylase small chain 3A n=1 Tax=Corchorus olitorius TaxID=93759 RepID=A0A1R3K7Z1_9ROSI|nr:Ribulose bisphosphate carboxylase small chain 3A [Corchorus olitorius]
MVPTEEEYLDLLKVPVGDLGRVYWRNFQTQVQKKMTEITGIKSQTWGEQLRELKKLNPNSRGFKVDFLLRWAGNHLDHERGLRAVALLIYGLVLFPKSRGVIDEAVVDLFEQLENGRNPIPTILAEPFGH